MERPSDVSRMVELGVLGHAMVHAARAAGIGILVSVHDDDGVARNIYVNEALVEILGRPSEELLATEPTLMVAPEDRAFARERMRARAAGDMSQARYELCALRGDGARVWVELTASGVDFNGRYAVMSFVIDITKRKLAEDARAQTEARFRELIEKAPEPIAIIRDEHFVYVNAAYVSALGYATATEVRSRPLSEHVVEYDVLERRMRLLLGGDSKLAPFVYHCRRRDGSIVEIEASSVPLDYEGSPAILTMGRDVTERRALEARLVQADRLAALGTMAAGVAHEINNPLAYLMLNLDWIARKLFEGAQDRASMDALAEILLEARRGAERVATIVRELRSFSRADGETRRNVDLASVVQSAIRISAHEVRHRARVVTHFAPAQRIWANEARVEQVVLNLLLNAAQAMPDSRPDGEIRVSVRPGDGDRVYLEVADNAGGIAPEVLPRIFDPFFTTKPTGIGTGLGLSICHGIVGSLGGQITVHSEPGAGTTFRVAFRASDSAEEITMEAPPSGEAPALQRPRSRILVVDDEVQIAVTLRELLAADHDVVATTSGAEALAVVRAGSRFDVVLCDLMMPGMSGIDFFEALRRETPGLERRVVFMTGGAFTARAAEFLASVDNRHIEKPFSLGVVERLVDELRAKDA